MSCSDSAHSQRTHQLRCIVQDCRVDWEMEAARMADIYKGSILTLCAAVGSDCTSGLFHKRYLWESGPRGNKTSVELVEDAETSFVLENTAVGTQKLQISRTFDHESSRRTYDSMIYAKLFKRGWTFQERFLSTRCLLFLRSEIVWECRTLEACECGDVAGDGLPLLYERLRGISASTGYSLDLSSSIWMRPGKVDKARSASLSAWARFVEDYSDRRLTHDNDKLPAFSGIAKHFERPERGRYLAGLWESDLPLGLLWYSVKLVGEWPPPPPPYHHSTTLSVENKHHKSCRSERLRAPTWSWSSMNVGINCYMFIDHRCYIVAEVLEVLCSPAGGNPFGEVAYGSMHLRAPLLTLEVVTNDFVSNDGVFVSQNIALNIDDDQTTTWLPVALASGTMVCKRLANSSDRDGLKITVKPSSKSTKMDLPQWLFLLVIESTASDNGQKSWSHTKALCLTQTNNKVDVFMRYGVFSIGSLSDEAEEAFTAITSSNVRAVTIV